MTFVVAFADVGTFVVLLGGSGIACDDDPLTALIELAGGDGATVNGALELVGGTVVGLAADEVQAAANSAVPARTAAAYRLSICAPSTV